MMMGSASPHPAAIFASGLSKYPFESVLIGFAVVMFILLLLVRARRAHNLKLRRAASTGFYDFDVAHYGYSTSGSSPPGTPSAPSDLPLAPTFASSARGDETKPRAAPVAPLPVPTSFAEGDRPLIGPLPEFDRHTGAPQSPKQNRPVATTSGGSRPEPPPPSSSPASSSSLPLLEQPPPPTDPRSD